MKTSEHNIAKNEKNGFGNVIKIKNIFNSITILVNSPE